MDELDIRKTRKEALTRLLDFALEEGVAEAGSYGARTQPGAEEQDQGGRAGEGTSQADDDLPDGAE